MNNQTGYTKLNLKFGNIIINLIKMKVFLDTQFIFNTPLRTYKIKNLSSNNPNITSLCKRFQFPWCFYNPDYKRLNNALPLYTPNLPCVCVAISIITRH